jgi:hypothetical protein
VSKQNIKIPEKHYVGLVKRQTEKIPLGFITPWGEDSAAKKRIATVDSWSKQRYRGDLALPAMVIDNVPMSGFKMTTDIRSSSYGGVDKWRIEDPRGFELEITSHNLAQLLSVGMIDRGEIADTCVWAREGQNNVLLSTSTDEYKAAVKNTEVAAMAASWKDVKIGNTVLLQNNVTGVWLGRMHGMYIDSGYGDKSTQPQVRVSDKSMHVIYINEETKSHKHKLLLVNNPKLAAITSADIKTDAEAEILVNSLLNDSTCNVEQPSYKTYIALVLGAPKVGKTAYLSLDPITIDSAEDLEKKTYYRTKQSIFMNPSSNSLYKVVSSKNYQKNIADFKCAAYSWEEFENHQLVPVGSTKLERGSWGRATTSVWHQNTHDYIFNDKDIFYTIKVTIKTNAGNSIEATVR